jgi:hypothetical protein
MVVCPGFTTEMEPPYAHISLQDWFSAGFPPIIHVDEPGVQGAVSTGTQGIGVRTPIAAAVAEATVGFIIDEHMPKGITLTIGLLSIIVAIAITFITFSCGSTISVEGAAPNVHCNVAPPHTAIAIC